MHAVLRSYTNYFNKKYKKVGHLWQNRFKSKIINEDSYLIDCINYIEYNPVRAQISKSVGDYEWSSFRERMLSQNLNIKITDELDI